MSIRQTTPQSEITSYIEKRLRMLEMAIVRNFCVIGERCVNIARTSHTYTDQSGNLTSSMGYAVSVDGRLVQISSFDKVLNGEQGATDGQEYVKQLIRKYPSGIVLIVVAGMNYATYVSDKGYDVIDSAESLAEQQIPRMLKQLGLQ